MKLIIGPERTSRFLLTIFSDSLPGTFCFTFWQIKFAPGRLIGLFNWGPPRKGNPEICSRQTYNVYTLHLQFNSSTHLP